MLFRYKRPSNPYWTSLCKRWMVVCIECDKVCSPQNQPLRSVRSGRSDSAAACGLSAGTRWRTIMSTPRTSWRYPRLNLATITSQQASTTLLPVVPAM